MKEKRTLQEFEYFPNLEKHIERMAATGHVGNVREWSEFLNVINAICKRVLDANDILDNP